MTKILIMQPLPDNATAWLREQGAELVLADEAGAWREHAAAVRALVYYSVPVDKPLLDLLPALEVIGKRGAGVDTVDLAEVAARGIKLTNVGAGGNATSVAEHALTLLLAATREVPVRDRATREGRFRQRFEMPLVNELSGSRLGVVGAGHIGRRVAEMCRNAFGCEIGFYDPYGAPAAGTMFPTLGVLLEWADNAIVAAPLTGESRGMIGRPELRLLGPEGVVVIISRGGIVDEDALAEALVAGEVRGAATDVYDREPPRDDHPLFGLPGIVLSPHVAGGTRQSRERTSLTVCQQVWALLNGAEAPLVGAQPWLARS
ncbi:2-hydroxyacid dehydrogenase [Phytohabitans suffuscus]|uniref:D-3-phosphoglycerate dehydrogenase n=1 Tax=Phytohabitans suffuscus TaxID=624315 RepID=A0A6F8YYW4_9ACTN|nr:NAD(P)-dependent oxidoreductase [Phytohabitans suffuscus]BCB91272.1 hypothetical protein Psuf_085850 [Phytohabitans suffuscus]